MSNSTCFFVPAARFLRPGFSFLASLTRIYGVAERRESSGACEAPVGPARNAAGQAPSEAPCVPYGGRSPPGALTVAILGSGPALPSPELLPDRSQRAPRVRVVVPGGRGPVPPGAAVANRHRGTPLLAPYSGMPREHAPNERGWIACSSGCTSSQQQNACRSDSQPSGRKFIGKSETLPGKATSRPRDSL